MDETGESVLFDLGAEAFHLPDGAAKLRCCLPDGDFLPNESLKDVVSFHVSVCNGEAWLHRGGVYWVDGSTIPSMPSHPPHATFLLCTDATLSCCCDKN